eukprot:TRINITY_DN7807_c0_g1_i1.p1 TRINITY_DN7807_c0_g1~~TRINITY_DN7807_c0_g1_i1.p1  ORF type:complete len:138 (+),score=30.28 TRINITY_DN7807_c0_g1_i1:424-837(+)
MKQREEESKNQQQLQKMQDKMEKIYFNQLRLVQKKISDKKIYNELKNRSFQEKKLENQLKEEQKLNVTVNDLIDKSNRQSPYKSEMIQRIHQNSVMLKQSQESFNTNLKKHDKEIKNRLQLFSKQINNKYVLSLIHI